MERVGSRDVRVFDPILWLEDPWGYLGVVKNRTRGCPRGMFCKTCFVGRINARFFVVRNARTIVNHMSRAKSNFYRGWKRWVWAERGFMPWKAWFAMVNPRV